MKVYYFDALIQNPDRRFSNPNLSTLGEDIMVYDHELAFSVLESILPSSEPWRVSKEAYLKDHVFYRQLKGRSLDLAPATAALAKMAGKGIAELVAIAPAEWNNRSIERIAEHLEAVGSRAEEFAEEITSSLA